MRAARQHAAGQLPGVPPAMAAEFIAAGHHYGIPPAVLAGVATIESGMGANRGPSSAGAVGLMQFEPATAAGLGFDPTNDRQAIWGAAKYLHQLGYSTDAVHALSSYNAGPAATGGARAQGNGYARQVMTAARRLGSVTAPAAGAGAGASSSSASSGSSGSSSDGLAGRALGALLTTVLLTAGAALTWAGVRGTLGASSSRAPA